ncbi:MAG: hypothetical protein SFY67_11160 [Candidatus Melainabacteria bacterium]|nr:hypothetical protein [Candidatus Melainabacteria bacterium]
MIEANQLIQNVTDKYASCWSYRDSGTAFSRDFVVEFETLFTRPDRFLFRWKDHSHPGEKLIHFENGIVILQLQEDQVEIPKLQTAITMASGSSLLASSLLGSLLLPELVHTRVDFMPVMQYEVTEAEHEGENIVLLLSTELSPNFIQKLRIDVENMALLEWEQLIKAEFADRTYLQMENFLVSQTQEVLSHDSEIGARVMFKHVSFDK